MIGQEVFSGTKTYFLVTNALPALQMVLNFRLFSADLITFKAVWHPKEGARIKSRSESFEKNYLNDRKPSYHGNGRVPDLCVEVAIPADVEPEVFVFVVLVVRRRQNVQERG